MSYPLASGHPEYKSMACQISEGSQVFEQMRGMNVAQMIDFSNELRRTLAIAEERFNASIACIEEDVKRLQGELAPKPQVNKY